MKKLALILALLVGVPSLVHAGSSVSDIATDVMVYEHAFTQDQCLKHAQTTLQKLGALQIQKNDISVHGYTPTDPKLSFYIRCNEDTKTIFFVVAAIATKNPDWIGSALKILTKWFDELPVED